jgi:hypothetical protein
MRRLSIALLALFVLGGSLVILADEGMWTFDNPPRKAIKAKYGFDLTDQ